MSYFPLHTASAISGKDVAAWREVREEEALWGLLREDDVFPVATGRMLIIIQRQNFAFESVTERIPAIYRSVDDIFARVYGKFDIFVS